MPLDSLSLAASLDNAILRDGLIDLHKSAYSLQTFRIENGRVRYDNGKPLAADSLSSGLDPSHIALTDIGVKLDSLYYGGRNMKAIISQFVLKERSGVEIVSATGRMVSNDKVLRVPSLKLETRDSYLELNAAMDWNALDFKDEGLVSARLMADIGKPDMVRFMGSMDESLSGSILPNPCASVQGSTVI